MTASETSPRRGRVLIMDDEEIILRVSSQIIEHLGYDVTSVHRGEEAFEEYRQAMETENPVGVVIADLLVQGGMGGKELAGLLLGIDPQARIVVSSGFSSDPVVENYRDHGFCAVILKPYRVEDLRNVIESALKGRNV